MGQLEREIYTRYYEDGFLDLYAGALMVTFGLGSLYSFGSYAAIASAVAISLWMPLKKLITLPRIGDVEFSEARQKKIDKTKAISLIFFSFTFVVGVAFFFIFATAKIGFLVELRALPSIALMTIAIIAFLGVAALMEVKRFGVYATVTLFALLAAASGRVDPMVALTEAGAFVCACGAFVFIRFLVRFPRLRAGNEH